MTQTCLPSYNIIKPCLYETPIKQDMIVFITLKEDDITVVCDERGTRVIICVEVDKITCVWVMSYLRNALKVTLHPAVMGKCHLALDPRLYPAFPPPRVLMGNQRQRPLCLSDPLSSIPISYIPIFPTASISQEENSCIWGGYGTTFSHGCKNMLYVNMQQSPS